MKMMEMDFALRQLRIGYRKSPNNRTERTIMVKMLIGLTQQASEFVIASP